MKHTGHGALVMLGSTVKLEANLRFSRTGIKWFGWYASMLQGECGLLISERRCVWKHRVSGSILDVFV